MRMIRVFISYVECQAAAMGGRTRARNGGGFEWDNELALYDAAHHRSKGVAVSWGIAADQANIYGIERYACAGKDENRSLKLVLPFF